VIKLMPVNAIDGSARSSRAFEPEAPEIKVLSDGLSARALALVLVASFMVVLDFSIVNVALPAIRDGLGFGGGSVQWVVTAYAITFGGLLILGGRAADIFGRRRTFVFGLLLFSGASLGAGLTGNALFMVLARAIQGLGAALVAPSALSLITTSYVEGPSRTRAIGLYGATASIGFVTGQVLGGVLVEFASWRSIFLVNVPVGIFATLAARKLIPRDSATSGPSHLDATGGLLATIAVAAAVFAVSDGGTLGWTNVTVVLATVLAVGSFYGLLRAERHNADPLIDLRLLRRRSLRTAGILTFLVGAWSAGELVVMSLYLQQTLHDSPLVTGLVIAPQGAIGFVTGMFGAQLAQHLGLRRLLTLATATAAVGFLALVSLPTAGHYDPAFVAVVLVGFGTVATVFVTTNMATSGMADTDQGLVGGVVNTTRQVGAAIGVAVLVAVAESSHGNSGITTVAGDRTALFVAAAIALTATIVAWLGTRSVLSTKRRAA
jgi:EmrB/QacA subfamily drug resistance transporter